MNRRSFLSFLGFTPFAGLAAVQPASVSSAINEAGYIALNAPRAQEIASIRIKIDHILSGRRRLVDEWQYNKITTEALHSELKTLDYEYLQPMHERRLAHISDQTQPQS